MGRVSGDSLEIFGGQMCERDPVQSGTMADPIFFSEETEAVAQ